jgi:replicative DNA helicase
MEEHQSKLKDIEKVLKEIGDKIEELVKKGADAGMDVKDEVEKKIQELKDNKTTLEAELKKGRDLLEREFKERKEDIEPKLKESKGFLLEGLKQFGLAFKALFGKK